MKLPTKSLETPVISYSWRTASKNRVLFPLVMFESFPIDTPALARKTANQLRLPTHDAVHPTNLISRKVIVMTLNRILIKSSLIFALLLGGCGGESAPVEPENNTNETQQQTPSDSATNNSDNSQSTPDAEETPAEPHPLASVVEGTYAIRGISVSEGMFPIIGRTKSTMTLYALATIEQVGDGFTITEQHCRYDMGGSDSAPSVDDAVPMSLDPVTTAIVFEGEGDNITFEREETVQLIGVRLDDPANDPLPEDADDSRIFDQEGDGKPGATAVVAGGIDGGQLISGEAYFVQRQTFAYSGTVTADGSAMTGLFVDDSTQKIVEATNDILLLEVTDSVAIPEESLVDLVRLNSTFDCAKLSTEAENLF